MPPGFRFTAKAHRGLTHSKRIDIDDDRRGLFDGYLKSIRSFGEKLGVILFQFPPYRRRDEEAFTRLLDALPDDLGFAFEFRHESWDGIEATIAERGGTVCISETQGHAPDSLPPGPHAYVRMRTDRYADEERTKWAALLEREANERDVYAFAKHEGIPADDPFGGLGLARWLVARPIPSEQHHAL